MTLQPAHSNASRAAPKAETIRVAMVTPPPTPTSTRVYIYELKALDKFLLWIFGN